MIGPDPSQITLHPLVVTAICGACAGLWVFAFKLLAFACIAIGGGR